MDPNTRALIMGAAGAGGAEKLYVEDVFSTWLHTGNGGVQTITNGIDLSGKGGMVWMKGRSGATNHRINDTSRGSGFPWPGLTTNSTAAATADADGVFTFDSTGFSVASGSAVNTSGSTYVSWTFRKAAKFFDVVTYVGNGTDGRQIAHNLGSTPGCVIIKRTDAADNWYTYHRSSSTTYGCLNLTAAFSATGVNMGGYNMSEVFGNSSTVILPTSTNFTVSRFGNVNASGGTYVAYLFAHDAGGFGDSGNDNVVSCGSYAGNGSTNGPTVTLSWEPQWVMIKRTDSPNTGRWWISDVMRGMPVGAGERVLAANNSDAELGDYNRVAPTPTGFRLMDSYGEVNASGGTYIYIAIRRGPMKTPTDATKVFSATTYTATGSDLTLSNSLGFANNLVVLSRRTIPTYSQTNWFADSLRGPTKYLISTSTGAESSDASLIPSYSQTTFVLGGNTFANFNGAGIAWTFRRAPGFFDIVCYAGTGSARTVSHNLGVAPELMIVKRRESDFWLVYTAALGNTRNLTLNAASAFNTDPGPWNNTSPTSTVFTVATTTDVNASGGTFVAYLFATLTGISKVGSYTGTGTTQQINCGFTAGARFVLIKRTDSTGDWYVWDTARGIVSGNDPYLLLNSTAAEVTNTDFIDPLNSGFEISSTAPAAVNANGGSFIYLAIA